MTATADLIITGADVYSVDAARSWTDAVAIRGGRVLALGAADVRSVTGPRTEILDVTGGLVVPGFQDAHVHPPFAGRNRLHVDLEGLPGRRAYLDRIGDYARTHPEDEWIVGGGWAMEHFPGGRPHRDDLDAIEKDRPVFLFNRDVHSAWVNSRALQIAGIDAGAADPADGRIERDPVTGEPTGLLHEGAAYAFNERVLPRPSRTDWEAAILDAQRHLHGLGITGWQDAWVTPDTQDAYQSLTSSGQLTARVVGALWWDRHRGLEQLDDLRSRRERALANGFRATSVKIMIDGIVETQTAAVLEPYCSGCHGDHGDRGLTYLDQDVLSAAVTELDALGFQVHMHAIGDRAVRMGLDAVEKARAANGVSGNRHHLAHLQIVQPQDIPRFRDLRVTANCQTYWAQSEPQMDELTIPVLGRDRADLQYPFADLHAAGVTLAMGSDWGVTTANPLEQMEVATTRIDPENRSNAPFLPEQALSLPVALAGFTAGSAFINHDDDAGRITIGARADLAVLDRNIFDRSTGPIGDAAVRYTIADGAVVHGN